MFNLCFFIILFLSKFNVVIVNSQVTGGTTSSGQYVCVPTGYCNTNANTSPAIDPRIVTPGQFLCPAGQVPCYAQGLSSQCGIRFVQQTNTGDGIADNGAYPWQVFLQNTTNPFAGSGVLIDNYRVLTAAHKVANNVPNPTSVSVLVGVYDPTQLANVQRSTVSRIVLHPNYAPTTLQNDIAILSLSTPIALNQNNVNTACLPATGAAYVGQRCVVSGWGQTSFTTNDAPTQPMKQVYVTIVDYTTCRNSFSNASLLGSNVDIYLDPSGEICAGGESMRDACTQDGGSPLVCPDTTGRNYIAGLVIWGKNCGQPGVYGVYVNVPYYRSWIDNTIENLNTPSIPSLPSSPPFSPSPPFSQSPPFSPSPSFSQSPPFSPLPPWPPLPPTG